MLGRVYASPERRNDDALAGGFLIWSFCLIDGGT